MPQSILLRGGTLVDPLAVRESRGDLRIAGGIIEAVGTDLPIRTTDTVIDVTGKLVMPGLVDIHVHIARCPDAHRMLVRAGVTTALDVAGKPDDIIRGVNAAGTGLTIGFLYPLVPGDTVKSADPTASELAAAIDFALSHGAMGVKILGGHYPLTREATRRAIELARARRCWITVHAGTVETPGDIRGLVELTQLAGTLPVHLAHINSYCRGIQEHPLHEAKRAFDALLSVPACRSESYLAMINGTSGKITDGRPASAVTSRCLIQGNYPDSELGLLQAIRDGWGRVHFHDPKRREVVLAEPTKGAEIYAAAGGKVMLSFAVNSPVAALPLALAKKPDGEFAVDALATDGGEIPRNVTLQQGLCLVKFGALTLPELVRKACLTPARLLGLTNKGLLRAGADADVTVADPDSAAVELVVAGGEIVLRDGDINGHGGAFITLDEGNKFCREQGLPCRTVAPAWLERR